jgi:hypothetical protein
MIDDELTAFARFQIARQRVDNKHYFKRIESQTHPRSL